MGCSTSEPVKLLTGGHDGCSIGGTSPMTIVGVLVAESEAGTAIRVDPDMAVEWGPEVAGSTLPVMWPPGTTGRRLSSGEVEVVHREGGVLLTTGRHVVLLTQFIGGGHNGVYTACGGREFVKESPRPLLFELAAVKARFEAECEDPTVLEEKTCDQIDIDGMFGKSPRSLWVPTDRTEYERLKVMCKEIARFAVDSEPLGFEDISVLASDDGLRASCRADG